MKTNSPMLPYSIRSVKSASIKQEAPKSSSVQQSAPIWVAFLSLTLELITDGSAFATVQSTINSEESDKVQPC